MMLFRATVIVGAPAAAFARDGMWKEQIKGCPWWMWKAALTLGVYAIFIACAQAIFPQGASLSEQALTVSGVPLAFDAISFCILYSVLTSDYLDEAEIISRALLSFALVAFGVLTYIAYRAGYLHPRTSYGP